MNQETYWRNLIADEIKAECDKVKAYYSKRGMNSGGMSSEEHTRLNIFRLCESIARTMKNSDDYVPAPDTPAPVKKTTKKAKPKPTTSTKPSNKEDIKDEFDEINSFIEEQIEEVKDKPVNDDVIKKLIKDKPRQNEFGELI